MCVLTIIKNNKLRQDEREFSMSLIGEFMALFANANRDPRKTRPIKRNDFFKFSNDIEEPEEIDPDLFNKVAQRLGSRIKEGTTKKKSNVNK